MNLYFVRHGQTDWNVQHLTQGWTDTPLNEDGVKQAEVLRNKRLKERNCGEFEGKPRDTPTKYSITIDKKHNL